MKEITLEDGRKIEISDKSYKAFEDSINELLVPDSIKIEDVGGSLGVVFNDEKQLLFYNTHSNVYCVSFTDKGSFVKCKLTPCDREDLKAGDLAYRANKSDPNFLSVSGYSIILHSEEDTLYVFTNGLNMKVSFENFDFWYKIEKA